MTALPDTIMPDGPLKRQSGYNPFEEKRRDRAEASLRAGLRWLAVAAVVAAFGVWAMPSMPGDTVMLWIKLLLSLTLLAGGVLVFWTMQPVAGPEVRIDPQQRCLTILTRGADGKIHSVAEHDIDSLRDIVLRDKLLTAWDADGAQIFALPVNNRQVEIALRDLLSAKRPA